MDPVIGIIELGDLLIDGGKIVAVGAGADSWAVSEIDGRDMIAMPGFINGHIHLWQTALRGLAADWTLDRYFSVLIGHVVNLYTPPDVYIGNLVGALDQINTGVTTLFDWCHIVNTPAHADAAVDGLRDARIRAVFAYGTPMTLFGTKEPHPIDARRMRRERLSADDGLVTMALAIRGTDFAPGTAEADIRFARELGLIASFHVACAKHGPRPQTMHDLARQGLLGTDINLVHANFLTADEFRSHCRYRRERLRHPGGGDANGARPAADRHGDCRRGALERRHRCRYRRKHRHVHADAVPAADPARPDE